MFLKWCCVLDCVECGLCRANNGLMVMIENCWCCGKVIDHTLRAAVNFADFCWNIFLSFSLILDKIDALFRSFFGKIKDFIHCLSVNDWMRLFHWMPDPDILVNICWIQSKYLEYELCVCICVCTCVCVNCNVKGLVELWNVLQEWKFFVSFQITILLFEVCNFKVGS